jgi:hypothetical protein
VIVLMAVFPGGFAGIVSMLLELPGWAMRRRTLPAAAAGDPEG